MRLILISVALFLTAAAGIANTTNNYVPTSNEIRNIEKYLDGSYEVAALCFGAGEETSGMNKICYYDCLGGKVAITIKSHKLCPLTIND